MCIRDRSEAAAQMALKAWRVERKAHNDKVQHQQRKELRDSGNMGSNHTGILYPQLRNMTSSVEKDQLMVNHFHQRRYCSSVLLKKQIYLESMSVSREVMTFESKLLVVSSQNLQLSLLVLLQRGGR